MIGNIETLSLEELFLGAVLVTCEACKRLSPSDPMDHDNVAAALISFIGCNAIDRFVVPLCIEDRIEREAFLSAKRGCSALILCNIAVLTDSSAPTLLKITSLLFTCRYLGRVVGTYYLARRNQGDNTLFSGAVFGILSTAMLYMSIYSGIKSLSSSRFTHLR